MGLRYRIMSTRMKGMAFAKSQHSQVKPFDKSMAYN